MCQLRRHRVRAIPSSQQRMHLLAICRGSGERFLVSSLLEVRGRERQAIALCVHRLWQEKEGQDGMAYGHRESQPRVDERRLSVEHGDARGKKPLQIISG